MRLNELMERHARSDLTACEACELIERLAAEVEGYQLKVRQVAWLVDEVTGTKDRLRTSEVRRAIR